MGEIFQFCWISLPPKISVSIFNKMIYGPPDNGYGIFAAIVIVCGAVWAWMNLTKMDKQAEQDYKESHR